MEFKLRKELISEKILSLSEIKDNPKSIEIYGKNENVDDLINWIKELGYDINHPILLNQDYEIISGHRRKQAAIKVGLKEVPVKIYKYSDKLDEWEDLLSENSNREKSNTALQNEHHLKTKIYNERGKENLIKSNQNRSNIVNQQSKPISSHCDEMKPVTINTIDARKQSAIDMGWSIGKSYQSKKIYDTRITLENNNKKEEANLISVISDKFKTDRTAFDIINQVEKDNINIASVLQSPDVKKIILKEESTPKDVKKAVEIESVKLKKEQLNKDIELHFTTNPISSEKLKEIQDYINRGVYKTKEQVLESINIEKINKLPEKFDVIVIDPPWPYGGAYDGESHRIASPYPEMSLEEISNIKIPATENSVIWLWTTHKFMRESFTLLDKWGFEDKVILTWVKNRMGMGSWLRSKSEFCIMAIKGHPKITLTNQTTVIEADVQEHSRKPDEFYKMVDSLCVGLKLDYFSREKRNGWYQIGNEPDKF